jgi:hypothetical protein
MQDNTTPASVPSDAAMTAQLNRFDPVFDVPSPVKIVGNVNITATPSLASLSPALRAKAEAKLKGGSYSEEAVGRAVHAVLIENSRDLRIRAGAGEDATETQRAMLQQANQVRLLQEEMGRIEGELSDVLGHKTEIGSDGKAVAVPIYRAQGQRRLALEAALDEKTHEMTLIAGIQGQRELDEANAADLARIKERREALADAAEVEKRAKQIARDRRINAQAEARARMFGSTL